MKWYIAVATAPRAINYLTNCISSLRDCGWEPVVFAEPGSVITDALTYNHPERLGVWRNWVFSVRTALQSDAEVIMTVQDDTLFHPDSKDFAEYIMWPSVDTGFVSLYTAKHYTVRDEKLLRKLRKVNPNISEIKDPGINRVNTRSLWGAMALIWPRKVLEHIIQDPLIESWLGAMPASRNPEIYKKRRENPALIQNSDTAISKLMNKHNYAMWFADPSPVTHVAKVSSIAHGDNSGRRNAYRPADHSIPLISQIPFDISRRVSL
jgi:hypothetical protein